jgi:hypothetical protein
MKRLLWIAGLLPLAVAAPSLADECVHVGAPPVAAQVVVPQYQYQPVEAYRPVYETYYRPVYRPYYRPYQRGPIYREPIGYRWGRGWGWHHPHREWGHRGHRW